MGVVLVIRLNMKSYFQPPKVEVEKLHLKKVGVRKYIQKVKKKLRNQIVHAEVDWSKASLHYFMKKSNTISTVKGC